MKKKIKNKIKMPYATFGHTAAAAAATTSILTAAGVASGIASAGIIPAVFATISVLCYSLGDFVKRSNPYFVRKMAESLGRLLVLAFLTIVDYATVKSIELPPSNGTPLQLLDGVRGVLAHDAEGLKLFTLYRELLEMMDQSRKNVQDLTAALSIAEAILLEMFTVHRMNVSGCNYATETNTAIPPEMAARPTARFWLDFEKKLFSKGISEFVETKDAGFPTDDVTFCDNTKSTKCCKGFVTNGYQCVQAVQLVEQMYPGRGGSRRKRSRRKRGGCWSKKK